MWPGTGQPRHQRPPDPVDRRVAAVIHRQHHVPRIAGVRESVGEGRVRAAEAEHRLVGVGGDDRRVRTGPDERQQRCRLRIEVLGIIDKEMPDAAALPGQQIRVGGEGRERRADEFGGVDGGCRCTGSREADRTAQQHVLLVLGIRPTGRHPFGPFVVTPQCRQILRAHPALGGAHQQITQRLREAVGGECRTQMRWPVPGAVLDVPGEQLPQHHVLFRAGDQPRRRIRMGGGLQPQDGKGVGVHGAHERLADRTAAGRLTLVCPAGETGIRCEHPAGDLLAQRDRRPPIRGDHQHRLRTDGRVGETCDRGVDDQ